eukprot:ctg_3393.g559
MAGARALARFVPAAAASDHRTSPGARRSGDVQRESAHRTICRMQWVRHVSRDMNATRKSSGAERVPTGRQRPEGERRSGGRPCHGAMSRWAWAADWARSAFGRRRASRATAVGHGHTGQLGGGGYPVGWGHQLSQLVPERPRSSHSAQLVSGGEPGDLAATDLHHLRPVPQPVPRCTAAAGWDRFLAHSGIYPAAAVDADDCRHEHRVAARAAGDP